MTRVTDALRAAYSDAPLNGIDTLDDLFPPNLTDEVTAKIEEILLEAAEQIARVDAMDILSVIQDTNRKLATALEGARHKNAPHQTLDENDLARIKDRLSTLTSAKGLARWAQN